MLFVPNPKQPIYNSLKNLKDDKSINAWFNLAIYDESTLSQLAQEIESMLNKIPDSYFTSPPFDFNHFQSPYQQLSFSDLDDIEWFRSFFASKKKLKKHFPLAILAFFDFSFLKYILDENPNLSTSRTIFKKSSDSKPSSYYPVVSKVKMLLLRHLKNLPTDAEIIKLLEENTKYAAACGLSSLVIPDESQINRFKNWGITPVQLLAIFYFIVTIAITHGIIDSYISATDSSILDSQANPSKRHLIGQCAKCPYSSTCPHPEWVSADVNASYTVKNNEVYYGHKVHSMVDSISTIVMGLFVSTASLHDNPLFIPLLKIVDKITSFRFKKYTADKGYDDKDNHHFVVDELEADPIIPHREKTKPSPSDNLFVLKDQLWHCTKANLPLRPNGSDKQQNASMFRCPHGYNNFSCPYASECLNPKQKYKTFKLQIKDDLRIKGTLSTPKGSLQWKEDFKYRTSVERLFSDNIRVRQLESFSNTNLTAIFTHIGFTFIAHNIIVLFNHFRDTLL
ncbi:MAG: transposase [Nitrospirota bacterium]